MEKHHGKKMKFGSLFSGIGGMDLGFERAGFEIKFQVEIDPFCRQVLQKHWPDVPKYGDIKECGGHNLAPVDVLVGGFPCQPFSVAGPRRGEADPRWLWPEMFRIVEELLPSWVVAENPPGIAPALEGIRDDLESLGYETLCIEVPATAFGAPHLRYRVFIIAHLDSKGCSDGSGGAGQAEQARGGKPAADSGCDNRGLQPKRNRQETTVATGDGSSWPPEPGVGRVVYGLSRRMGRLNRQRIAALGNAVVPAVAEWVGRAILKVREWPR